jgi:hypothetical protein
MIDQMRLKLWSELPFRVLHSKSHFVDLVGLKLHGHWSLVGASGAAINWR